MEYLKDIQIGSIQLCTDCYYHKRGVSPSGVETQATFKYDGYAEAFLCTSSMYTISEEAWRERV